ncbi:MAG: FAD-binding protein [Verrucomicrobia bacterium]|nr:FAD-binding protein [Verrucomicrobiota bacterium]MDA1065955.1 FAD-binding protein [Verrucomicrobiota bacterium]
MGLKTAAPTSVQEIIDLVKSETSIIPHGGGSKPSLWRSADSTTLVDMRNLSGILEYQSSEYTITVQAGTKLSEVVAALADNGQYLPFDPPLASENATIGGTVAAGLSGPGAYRYGPLKDFIIGVKFVDGLGNLIRGGGKVVKNAAGFDFPKLFNGSMGRLGLLTEVSFKVFPEPKSYVTLTLACDSPDEALKIIPSLKGYDLEGVELDSDLNLSLRLGYQEATMNTRKSGLESLVGNQLQMTLGESESQTWQAIKAFDWHIPANKLFKTATHPESALKLLKAIDTNHWKTQLSNGGKALYLSGDDSTNTESLDALLRGHRLTGIQIKGDVSSHSLIGNTSNLAFINRVQRALDPKGIFLPFLGKVQETA